MCNSQTALTPTENKVESIVVTESQFDSWLKEFFYKL